MIFENNPSDPETWSIWYHGEIIHVDFTSILHSLTPVGPSSVGLANLDRFRLFHQWECLKCNGHGLSVSCVKEPLSGLGLCACNPRSRAIWLWLTPDSLLRSSPLRMWSLALTARGSALRLMLLVSLFWLRRLFLNFSLNLFTVISSGWWRILPSTNCHNICNLQPERL